MAEELRLERERLDREGRMRAWLAVAVALAALAVMLGGLVTVAAVIR